MRGGREYVVWLRATRRLAGVSIFLLRKRAVRKEGSPARGGAIHEKQGESGDVPGFRVLSVFPLYCKHCSGSSGGRSKFASSSAACGDSRRKTRGAIRCKQGDA